MFLLIIWINKIKNISNDQHFINCVFCLLFIKEWKFKQKKHIVRPKDSDMLKFLWNQKLDYLSKFFRGVCR
jgi:hypothetical protein